MSYYDTVRDRLTFAQKVKGKDSLSSLVYSESWKSAASQWDCEHLFAHRVICKEPRKRLPLFESRRLLPNNPGETSACIKALVQGPESVDALKYWMEPQFVQHYEPDSLGYVWAALTPFVRAGASSNHQVAASEIAVREASKRVTRRPAELQDFVPSDQMTFGSSPPDFKHTSDSQGSHSTLDYIESVVAPPVEDASVRLAGCFIRCVLNYGQSQDQTDPFLYFRDERQRYTFWQDGICMVHAIDDGGIQFINQNGQSRQVAMLEAKRHFARVDEGKPIISDQQLAQMFFHFHISDNYHSSYVDFLTDSNEHLLVESTVWMDIKNRGHREDIAAHILALIAWGKVF
ncbi:hypothetical protein CP532_1991 [Ophiocordyceps camponoti-leonardi (nom. inval.)]|nr:hypothetical protein CP532_1991 [Ophiocordyceps camponoti-leonardi (nom. inval.)]